MDTFPPLFENCPSYYIVEAYDRIKTFHKTGYLLLLQLDVDIIQLKVAADNIRLRCFPLLDNLIYAAIVPRDWLEEVKDLVHEVEESLRARVKTLQDLGSAADK